jgi:hypothetical protein
MSGARQFSLKWQNPAARVPLREIVFADASPQTPGEHHHRSASPENGLIQDVLRVRQILQPESSHENRHKYQAHSLRLRPPLS